MMLRVSAVLLLLLVMAITSACGLLSRRDHPYQDAGNQAPLQVPEGLDRPAVDDALRIPEVRASATRSGVPAAQRAPGGRAVSVLALADSSDSVWRRVGLALERMGDDVQVLQADPVTGRYQVSMTGSQRNEGMFRRMLRRDRRVQEQFNLIIEPAAEGTTVRTEGGAALARELLQRLDRRLG